MFCNRTLSSIQVGFQIALLHILNEFLSFILSFCPQFWFTNNLNNEFMYSKVSSGQLVIESNTISQLDSNFRSPENLGHYSPVVAGPQPQYHGQPPPRAWRQGALLPAQHSIVPTGTQQQQHAVSSRVIERYSINVDEPIIGVTTVAATTPDKVHQLAPVTNIMTFMHSSAQQQLLGLLSSQQPDCPTAQLALTACLHGLCLLSSPDVDSLKQF